MPGIDSDTKLMLHMNGSDASTTFTDDSPSAHSVTANGTVQIDTDQSKFSGASGLFDGNSDYLSIADSTDWDIFGSNSTTVTIDYWVKVNDTSKVFVTVAQRENGVNRWAVQHRPSTSSPGIRVILNSNGSGTDKYSSLNSSGAISDSDWHHVAVVLVGNGSNQTIGIYLDGTQVSYVQGNDTDTFSGQLYVGQPGDSSQYFDGWMDELRIQYSNPFGASPNSGLTDTITVPTEEYSSAITEDLDYTINLTSILTDNKRYSESLNYNINNSVFLTDHQTYLESLEYTANITQGLFDFQTYLENLSYNIVFLNNLQDIQSYIDNLNYIIDNSYSITDLQNYIDSLNYTINYLLTVADLKPGINFNPFKNQWNIPENIKLNWSINPIKINYKLPENFKIYWK